MASREVAIRLRYGPASIRAVIKAKHGTSAGLAYRLPLHAVPVRTPRLRKQSAELEHRKRPGKVPGRFLLCD